MTERSLGQVAYEKYAEVFTRHIAPWASLRPPVRVRWELIAAAVLEECGGSGD
jgi:hypothetical protein